jgi:hypothetical protein
MAGVFATLGLLIRAVGATPVGQRPDLRRVWLAFGITVAASLAVYALYLITGEGWIWYH